MSFDLRLKNGDLSITNSALESVVDSDKLVQDILKIALTPAGSNPYQIWYGSLLSKTLIGSSYEYDIILSASQSQLQLALNTLQSLQTSQLHSFQKLTAEEQLGGITGLDIRRDPSDPRSFSVGIAAINRAFKTVQASFIVSPY